MGGTEPAAAPTPMAIASLTDDVARVYQQGIVDAGKQPELFALIAFLMAFALVRLNTHMIRRGVSWWPGNVQVGGTHIHHLVWGILLLLVVGYVGVTIEPPSPWQEGLAVLFGVGAALTLDEFALWLNLRDVYWSAEGRESIDAVVVAGTLGALAILGFRIWVDLAEDVELLAQLLVAGAGATCVALAFVNALKGKALTAVASLVVPPVGIVGALRLARPGSVWARLYSADRRAHAEARSEALRRRRARMLGRR